MAIVFIGKSFWSYKKYVWLKIKSHTCFKIQNGRQNRVFSFNLVKTAFKMVNITNNYQKITFRVTARSFGP